MSEEQFLKCTLRKIFSLLEFYQKINGIEEKPKKKYIDQVLF